MRRHMGSNASLKVIYMDKMTQEEMVRIFNDCNLFIKEMGKPERFHINTKSILFTYDGECRSIDDVTLLVFHKGKVYFNDEAFELDRMDEAPFMVSTKPSETIHPLVKAYYSTLGVAKAFGLR